MITNLDLVECNIHSSHCFAFSGHFHYPAALPFSSAPSPTLIISFAPYVAERYMAPPTSGPSFYSLIALAERGGCGRFCVVRSRHREQGRRRRRHGRWDRDGESGRTGREKGKGRCFGVVIKSHTGRYWASWYVPAGPPGPPSHQPPFPHKQVSDTHSMRSPLRPRAPVTGLMGVAQPAQTSSQMPSV